MITRRTFLQLLLSTVVAPATVLAAPKPPRVINITIESDPGMVSVDWVREQLLPALEKGKKP